jgi:hypothetical protein
MRRRSLLHGWIVMLIKKCHIIELIPVKFEFYDESLYQELVSIRASNGHVTLGVAII